MGVALGFAIDYLLVRIRLTQILALIETDLFAMSVDILGINNTDGIFSLVLNFSGHIEHVINLIQKALLLIGQQVVQVELVVSAHCGSQHSCCKNRLH